MYKTEPPSVRFWKKVNKKTANGCWEWTGWKTYHGYGLFIEFPKRVPKGVPRPPRRMAHRLSWEYTKGKIPKGLECCHKCDNPACINPAHLFLGTHKQNMQDMTSKGRQAFPKGELHGQAKLTESKVKKIRESYRRADCFQSTLATEYGVSRRLIYNIVNRLAWKHVA